MKKNNDLEIKIVSKDEAFFTEVVKTTEMEIERIEKLLRFNKFILENALKEIEKYKL